MWIINYFKRKMITNNDTVHFYKCYPIQYNNNNEDSSTIMEKYSCWSVLLIDGLEVEAKILHKGRGKFRIVEDNYKSKYVNKIVDASDVIRCKLEPDEVRSFIMRNKLAGLEPSGCGLLTIRVQFITPSKLPI
jgi:hypothetical protein